ncbi:DUF4868 domain-containing protein [Aerococcaceae bacterium zg-ZJ1578]|uniref:Kiwa anti-phage protein KwaB-like domain-containing protein n=1 Tax=Aerococcaceae bacterium zg-252 TaxID=2796928 RepID=UPI001A1F4C4D|nr:DUF4868 domain-containing protein [Aerococcaceae bacterium zg-1578]
MTLNRVMEIVTESEMIHLHFCNKNEGNYHKLTPDISDNIRENVKAICQKNLERIGQMTVVDYNPIGVDDGVIEKCQLSDYGEIPRLLEVLDATESGVPDPKDTSFYVYEFQIDEHSAYIFRRHNKLQAIRKGILGYFIEGKFSSIVNQDFFGIDDKIDLIIFENSIWINNHIAFERIFNLQNEFKNIAARILNNPRFSTKIVNFEQLKDGIMENMNYVKRVSKLNENNALIFLNDTADKRVREVISDLDLDIEIDEEQRFIYRDRSQISNFVNFMQDAYYRTLIGEEMGVDERR